MAALSCPVGRKYNEYSDQEKTNAPRQANSLALFGTAVDPHNPSDLKHHHLPGLRVCRAVGSDIKNIREIAKKE
jgi:hypothetical protein